MTITILQRSTRDDGTTADVDIVCKEESAYNRCNVPAKKVFDELLKITEAVNLKGKAVLFEVER